MIASVASKNGTKALHGLQALGILYEQGYTDEVIDLTVHKLLERQIQKDEAQLAELATNLSDYEQQYGMSSNVFFNKYQSGELGDDIDFFEWQSLYKMHQRLHQAVTTLREATQSES